VFTNKYTCSGVWKSGWSSGTLHLNDASITDTREEHFDYWGCAAALGIFIEEAVAKESDT